MLEPGWKAYANKEQEDSVLPDSLTEGAVLAVDSAQVKEGKTTPPKHFTEDTILASMETAGVEDMPEDVERRGIGTPPPVPVSWKSWCPLVLWSGRKPRRSPI